VELNAKHLTPQPPLPLRGGGSKHLKSLNIFSKMLEFISPRSPCRELQFDAVGLNIINYHFDIKEMAVRVFGGYFVFYHGIRDLGVLGFEGFKGNDTTHLKS
jgi:hypothetical protein